MKRITFFLTLLLMVFLQAPAQNTDSLAWVSLRLAAQRNIEELRPLLTTYGNNFPRHIQLFCQIAISFHDGEDSKVISCLDSLNHNYQVFLPSRAQLTLSEIHAETLRRQGKYQDLYDYCQTEIKDYESRRFETSKLWNLYAYRKQAQQLMGNSIRSRLLQYADRYMPFELDSLYTLYKNSIDDYTRLRCDFILSQAFNKKYAILSSSKSLITTHADSLNHKDFAKFAIAHAEQLVQLGRWNDLKIWIATVKEKTHAEVAALDFYHRLSTCFQNNDTASVVYQQKEFTIPTTYEWPILFQASLNEGGPIPFTISLEQPYTVITEDMAQRNHIKMLNDTIHVVTSQGLRKASPAIVGTLQIGGVIFKHFFAYVVLNGNEAASSNTCALGLNEFKALGHVTFSAEKMHVSLQENNSLEEAPYRNLFFSPNQELLLMLNDESTLHPFSIDLNYPNNIISHQTVCDKEQTDDFTLYDTNKTGFKIDNPFIVDAKSRQFDGILGVPFLRAYETATFDFASMKLSKGASSSYQPARGYFGYHTDKHYLRRNQEALRTGAIPDGEENIFLALTLALGKNQPKEVIRLSEQLRTKGSKLYDAYTEAEALLLLGEYQKAEQLLENILDNIHSPYPLNKKEMAQLQQLLQKSQLFKQEKPVSIQYNSPTTTLKLDKRHWTDIRINEKKVKANIDLFFSTTSLTEKTARKLKIKILGKAEGHSYGLISEMDFGDIILQNVPCLILTHHKLIKHDLPKKGIRIGWDVLRLFKNISYASQSIRLSSEEMEDKGESANIYRNNQWFIETESGDGFPTYQLIGKGKNTGVAQQLQIGSIQCLPKDFHHSTKPIENDMSGEITLPFLISKRGNITFDLVKMKLITK